MPKCGVCGWTFSDRTLTKHAETPCGEDDIKAPSSPTCGDCLTPLSNCIHGYYLRQEK